MWGWSGWPAAAIVWVCVPAPHVARHALGLADTIHPNTWTSIAQLAAFALLVVGIGTGGGILLHARLASRRR